MGVLRPAWEIVLWWCSRVYADVCVRLLMFGFLMLFYTKVVTIKRNYEKKAVMNLDRSKRVFKNMCEGRLLFIILIVSGADLLSRADYNSENKQVKSVCFSIICVTRLL
nr:hypothetical protein [Tanacetum cinerariifolium]